jgi:hypothetical protein
MWCGKFLALPLIAACLPAMAVLGEPAAQVQADQIRLQASRSITPGVWERHTLRLADGSEITQWAQPGGGKVVAIEWRTHFKPRLDELLGRYFAAYQLAAQAGRRGTPTANRHLMLQAGDLVVENQERLQVYTGRAYLASAVNLRGAAQ